jgi:hypothetical protein
VKEDENFYKGLEKPDIAPKKITEDEYAFLLKNKIFFDKKLLFPNKKTQNFLLQCY